MKQKAIIIFILLFASCKLNNTPVNSSRSEKGETQISLYQGDNVNNSNIPFQSDSLEEHAKIKGRLRLSKEIDHSSREFGGAFIDESLMFRTR